VKYKDALNMILRSYPGPTDAMLIQKAKDRLRIQQLKAAVAKFDGWPFLRREAIIRSSGGYDTGTVAVTQDSTTVTLTDGTWPSDVVGWIFGLPLANTERYKVKTRSSDTVIVLERPYEGATGSGLSYTTYQMPLRLPVDYFMAESIACEAGGRTLGFANLGYVRGIWPKPVLMGEAKLVMLTEPTKSAAYETGTVTITKASATVTGSGTTFPTWCVDHFIRFSEETAWYKIKSRDSDTQLTLWRNYGGQNAAAGVSYQIDPPGCLQFEYLYPREDQFTFRLNYFCLPEELVNESDMLEGDEAYAHGICDLAAADVLAGLPSEQLERFGTEMRSRLKSGNDMLAARIAGQAEPDLTPAMQDIRYSNRVQH
jgi:hypothetical protein